MIYLYGHSCYINIFDRIWELSLFSCYLNSIIFFLFTNSKTYNFEQTNKRNCCSKKFKTFNMFCKTKCALIMPSNNNY